MANNHSYEIPEKGARDWHVPINNNFERLDAEVEIRDEAANLEEYAPKEDAKFLATDTGSVFVGDGDGWESLSSSGPEPTFSSVSTDSLQTRSRAMSYIIWQDDDDVVHADGPSEEASDTFDSLPDAVDFAFDNARTVTIAEGRYFYSEDIVVPGRAHLHLEGAELDPEDCHGIRIGDGENETVQVKLTGSGKINPDSWGDQAESCLCVYGAKLLTVDAKLWLNDGCQKAALLIDGGDIGSWWNYYSNLYVKGRFQKHSSGSTPANAQAFSACMFKGQMDIDGGNSLWVRDSFFETIDGDKSINVNSEAYLNGRFEEVEVNVSEYARTHIDAVRWSNCDLTVPDSDCFVTCAGSGFETGDKRRYQDNSTLERIVSTGAYTVEDEAVMQLENTYSSSGQNNLLRTVAAGRNEGYFLQGVNSDGAVDKEVEVNGDYRNDVAGRGYVVKDKEDGHHYRITTENGELAVEGPL